MNDNLSQLNKQAPIDHVMNVLKASIAVVPYGGGVVASLINDYIPNTRQKRTLEFIQNVSEDLENMKEMIDCEYVKSEEFSYLFQKAWKAAVEQYQSDRINGFRAILVNSAIQKKATIDEKELYINILNDLTGYHFQMIKVFQDPIKWNEDNGNKVKGASIIISLSQILIECFPDWGEERIAIILDSLYGKKLCNISSDRIKVGQTGGGIEKLNHALTAFGRRFVDYVTVNPINNAQIK